MALEGLAISPFQKEVKLKKRGLQRIRRDLNHEIKSIQRSIVGIAVKESHVKSN